MVKSKILQTPAFKNLYVFIRDTIMSIKPCNIKYTPFKLTLFAIYLLLNACATTPHQQWDCTGLAITEASTYNKNTRLFMKDDKKLVRAYGLKTMSTPKTLLLKACSSFPDENHPQTDKRVYLYSSGYYGSYSYLHCAHQSDEPSVQIYEIFINWAKQPLHTREQTLSQTNAKIRALNCPNSSAKTNEAAWYVENEQHGQTPVLVSNARERILSNGIFANRTIAIDLETAQYIMQQIKSYFKKSDL